MNQQTQRQDPPPPRDPMKPQGPEPGKPLAKKWRNPKCGKEGHYCVDRQGNYQPDFVQLFIQRGPTTAASLPFNNAQEKTHFFLPTDRWVDAPAWIVAHLRRAVEDHMVEDPDADPRTHDEQPREIVEKRRFFFEALPSK